MNAAALLIPNHFITPVVIYIRLEVVHADISYFHLFYPSKENEREDVNIFWKVWRIHREIKEERKSGNISGEIRIGPKRP